MKISRKRCLYLVLLLGFSTAFGLSAQEQPDDQQKASIQSKNDLRRQAIRLVSYKHAGVLPLLGGADAFLRFQSIYEMERAAFRRSVEKALDTPMEKSMLSSEEADALMVLDGQLQTLSDSSAAPEPRVASRILSPIKNQKAAQIRNEEAFFRVEPGTAVFAVARGDVIAVEQGVTDGHVVYLETDENQVYVYRGVGMLDVVVGDEVLPAGRIGLAAGRVVAVSREVDGVRTPLRFQ